MDAEPFKLQTFGIPLRLSEVFRQNQRSWHYSRRNVATIFQCARDNAIGPWYGYFPNSEKRIVHALRTKWRDIHWADDCCLISPLFLPFPIRRKLKLYSKFGHMATMCKIFTSLFFLSMRTIFHHSKIPGGVLFLHYYCSGWCVYPIFMPVGCYFNALWELNNNSQLQSVFFVLRNWWTTWNRILSTRKRTFRFRTLQRHSCEKPI